MFQRPQHLMTRFARERRVFFLEEPVFEDSDTHLRSTVCPQTGVNVATPVLRKGMAGDEIVPQLKILLDQMLKQRNVRDFIAWYYTPMARDFARHLSPLLTIYDCMDELSAFAGAPAAMRSNEKELFDHADLVFTGGASLFESKRSQHRNVHLFPSSVDVPHFARARAIDRQPDDQAGIPKPRFGYAGVIDERMDTDLLRSVASRRPDWHFVLLGPVVKIDPASLPQGPNLHYLGMKPYASLPEYLSGWDIGMLPFARNESTRFISPTKTPEYLAAGLRVLSTPIRDVVTPYGDLGLAGIVNDAGEFVSVAESLLMSPLSEEFRRKVELFLAQSSWDKTWTYMNKLINTAATAKNTDIATRPKRTRIGALVAEGADHV